MEPPSFFIKSHIWHGVGGGGVFSNTIFIMRNGLRWCEAPREYDQCKTLYYRWKRSNEKVVFDRFLMGLAAEEPEETAAMSEPTFLVSGL
jgi:hypothetical protein